MPRSRYHRVCTSLALAFAFTLISTAMRGEDNRSSSPPPKKSYKTSQLLYLDVTTDKTGAVSQVEFINRVPENVQSWIRGEIMGKHFGIANHTYRRVVELRVPR